MFHLLRHGSRITFSFPSFCYASQCFKIMNKKYLTAGIIIIGDEILKGQAKDTNSHFFCRHLFALGVKVKEVSVISDNVEDIACKILEFSPKYSHVITSGGIGPTHDDVTFEGAAKAFNMSTYSHPDIVQLLKDYFGSNLDAPKLKMAQVPEESVLHIAIDKETNQHKKYTLVSVKNVYMFPGVPSLLERGFHLLKDLFRNPDITFHTENLYICDNEISIASGLQKVATQLADRVTIGSYPDFNNSYYKVRVTLDSICKKDLQDAVELIKASVPIGSVVGYDSDPIGSASLNVYRIVNAPSTDTLHSDVREAVSVIEQTLDLYSLNEICLGFNGGKDCTLLLHLLHAVMQRRYPALNFKLPALYIRSQLPFPEVELFVQNTVKRYNLNLIHYDGRIKHRLESLIKDYPSIRATLMGTRKTDPFSSHLTPFCMTDPDWPQIMRVNPILNWTYKSVWSFIRTVCLPYCSLYDQGYTSLGSMNNTHPNPSLRSTDENSILSYRPAYELVENGNERDGRNVGQ